MFLPARFLPVRSLTNLSRTNRSLTDKVRNLSILAGALLLTAVSVSAAALSLDSITAVGETNGPGAPNEILVNQSDIELLGNDEMLDVTLDGETVLTLDYSEGFINLNRISVAVPDGRVMNLFQTAKHEPRWNVFQESGRFSISDDPNNFTELTAEEVSELTRFGSLETNEFSAMRMNAGCWCILVLDDGF